MFFQVGNESDRNLPFFQLTELTGYAGELSKFVVTYNLSDYQKYKMVIKKLSTMIALIKDIKEQAEEEASLLSDGDERYERLKEIAEKINVFLS
jgi:hypothetical protein